ncbi:MAG TPA: hypothetical protein VKA70_19065 [Blastocatellia bacterium]|nr:hypothetical protein [Blastocatellia bacterium]
MADTDSYLVERRPGGDLRDRVKWALVGIGSTFGLHVIISLIFASIAQPASSSTMSVIVFGMGLGAFLIGGFIVGWMSEELRLIDSLVVVITTLALTTIVMLVLPATSREQFVTVLPLGDLTGHPAESLVFISLAGVAAVAGTYIGWHVTVPQEGIVDRIALVVGLLGAIVGPFLLLSVGGREQGSNQPALPWYFLGIVLLLVLIIMGVGFFMFTRESHHEEEISISPDRKEI